MSNLINCNDCGKPVSEYGDTCPHCGGPIDLTPEVSRDIKIRCIILAALALIVWLVA